MDVTLMARIIERGLVKDGRIVRLRVHLPDHPGTLHRLTGVIAAERAIIVETSGHRVHFDAGLGYTVIDLTMETRGADHGSEMTSALLAAGYSFARVL